MRADMARDASLACVITTYNSASWIERALASVYSQTLQPSEIVLADDCSKDGTVDLLYAIAKRDSRVAVRVRDVNAGPAANRDVAIRSCQSRYVTYLDSDDWISPDKFAADIEAIEADDRSVAVPMVKVVDVGGRIVDGVDTAPFCEAPRDEQWRLLAGRYRGIPIGPVTMTKSAYVAVGGQNHALRLYEDWDFHMRCLLQGLRFCCNGLYSYFYVRGHSSASAATKARHLFASVRVLARAAVAGAPAMPLARGAAHLLVVKPAIFLAGRRREHGFN